MGWSRGDLASIVAGRAPTTNRVERLIYLYAKSYLQDDILAKVDRASMACSLEVRAPFLDVDLVEFNEAFAAVAMRLMKDLDFPHEKTNVNGGSIAMGHPLGATGAMILGTLIDELERRDQRYGLATLCVGGGMGIATVVERI